VVSDSHSIRPKTLNEWNSVVDWIKLLPVPDKKNQLIVEFTLLESVPIQGLWYFGWGLARHFVTALNIGTMGFFWWKMPQHTSRYYEHIDDLEQKARIVVERSPILKVDWGKNRVLTGSDLNNVAQVFAALPPPHKRHEHAPYNYYIGGLSFLSINDIHWQCEIQAFGNFLKSLQEMMKSKGTWDGKSQFADTFGKFLDELFPEFDEREHYVGMVRDFLRGARRKLRITLREASFMKLFCDAYFLKEIRPAVVKQPQSKKTGA